MALFFEIELFWLSSISSAIMFMFFWLYWPHSDLAPFSVFVFCFLVLFTLIVWTSHLFRASASGGWFWTSSIPPSSPMLPSMFSN